MAEIRMIDNTDLHYIKNNLSSIEQKLRSVDEDIDTVNNNLDIVNENIRTFHKEFTNYVKKFELFVFKQMRDNRLGQAETRLVKIRQELENKYGYYNKIRRTLTGILQANDLAIIKKETINNVTEELMLSAPNYWLAPCLVGLAAWISDRPEISERAIREGVKRNDEKTSLLFSLICRRFGRKDACLKWTKRYFENQNEEYLDKKVVVIIDAFTSGLLGNDTEGIILAQMVEWLNNLSLKKGFVERQMQQWINAINSKRTVLNNNTYKYLEKNSKTWPVLKDVMEGALLHSKIFDYFTNIFKQDMDCGSLKERLDEILNTLVTEYDEEEFSLRENEKLEELVVEFKGDEEKAIKKLEAQKAKFEEYRDFTQLLTDFAMSPEKIGSSIATQKFSVALTKEWILNAYKDIIDENRRKVPEEIEISVYNFKDKTKNGENEESIINNFIKFMNGEKYYKLRACQVTDTDRVILIIGIIALVACIMIFLQYSKIFGVCVGIVGIFLVFIYVNAVNECKNKTLSLNKEYEQKISEGTKVIHYEVTEVAGFRTTFENNDKESHKVIDFLEEIAPEQYIEKLTSSNKLLKTKK